MTKMKHVVVVGAGIFGAVLAERMAHFGSKVILIEKRKHIGGNCYDHKDKDGGFIPRIPW